MTFPSDPDLTPPACEPTVARLQAVLDGDLPADALDADPHPAACPTCAERIRAARLMLAMLAEPAGRAIAEIPAAAKTGLEPVTGSAQKAFSRLLKDVGAVSPGKPKS